MKKYANLVLVTESYPYEVVRVVSDQTIEIREMKAERDPTWKPDISPGGFAGHCSNQSEQRWIYESDESRSIIRCRKRKDGYFHSKQGRHVLSDTPRRFYDYNF